MCVCPDKSWIFCPKCELLDKNLSFLTKFRSFWQKFQILWFSEGKILRFLPKISNLIFWHGQILQIFSENVNFFRIQTYFEILLQKCLFFPYSDKFWNYSPKMCIFFIFRQISKFCHKIDILYHVYKIWNFSPKMCIFSIFRKNGNFAYSDKFWSCRPKMHIFAIVDKFWNFPPKMHIFAY